MILFYLLILDNMVFDSLIHSLWTSIVGVVSNNNNDIKNNKGDKDVKKTVQKTISFPQGARFLNYRENKNIRGLPFLAMSTSELSENAAKANYIDKIQKRKSILAETAKQSMQPNLDNIEKFTKNRCVDNDAEYYRKLHKNNRDKQVAEQNRFFCLTGKDTSISEQNTLLFKNMPYTQYTKTDSVLETPWELQPIKIKTSPRTLCDVHLIGEQDRIILER